MKTSEVKVSVLMSAYNSESTVENSINSILNQTHKNLEILIVDDYSSDNTFDICEKIKKENNNIKLFKNNKNMGLTKSLNILINKANGVYIARQDSDDFSEKTRIEKQLEFMKRHKLDACTTRAKVIEKDNIVPNISYYFPKKILIKYKNPFIHGTLLIKKDVLEKLKNYDENFYYAQDYKLMTDLIKSNFKIKIIKKPLYNLNMENNISSIFSEEQKYFADCVRKNIRPS